MKTCPNAQSWLSNARGQPPHKAVLSLANLAVAYNATITGVFCYWAYFRVVADLPVVMSTVGTLMVPVIGVFATAWAFDTRPAMVDYVALVLVVTSVFLVMTRARSAER